MRLSYLILYYAVTFVFSEPTCVNIHKVAKAKCWGMKSGSFSEDHPNGAKKIRGMCVNKKPEGQWTCWDPKGLKLAEGNYKNGKGEGDFLHYIGEDNADKNEYVKQSFHGGMLDQSKTVEQEEGKDEKGRKHGLFLTSINGRVRKKEEFKHGAKVYEWISGVQEGRYVNNMKEGNWVFFYPSGSARSRGRFSRDKREGDWAFFADKEKLIEQSHFDNGLKNGRSKYYFANGDTLEGTFINDKKNGIWLKKNKNGVWIERMSFNMGRPTSYKNYAKVKSKPKAKRAIAAKPKKPQKKPVKKKT